MGRPTQHAEPRALPIGTQGPHAAWPVPGRGLLLPFRVPALACAAPLGARKLPCPVCLSVFPCVCLPCVCLPWVCLYAVSDQGFRPFFIWDLALGFQKLSQWCYQAAELKTKCNLAPDSCFLCGLGHPEAAQTGGSCRPLGSLTSLSPQMSDTGHLLCCQTGAVKCTSNEEPLHHCSWPWGSGDVRPSSSGHGRALCTLTPLAHCTSAASCREPVSK